MKFAPLFVLLGLVCIASGSPSNLEQHAVALRQRREVDIMGNTRELVKKLLLNLRASAQQAIDSIGTFTEGMRTQGQLYLEKLAKDLESLKNRVADSIRKITDRLTGTSAAVKVCIDSRKQAADDLFRETTAKSKSCADQRIKDVGDMVQKLRALADEAIEFSSSAIDDLKKCTDDNSGNILGAGTCLGSVAIRSELKGALFLSQSGLSITRINLAIATLPAALEVCAGTQLVAAGIGTAKIIMEVGSCSASSIFSTLTGNGLEA